MDPDNRGGSIVPISTLVIAIAAIGGWLLYDRPLQSLRPSQPDEGARTVFKLEDVEARLWEDPIAAVQRHADETHHPVSELTDAINGSLRPELPGPDEEPGQARLLIIPILAPGGPYAEDVEERRRQRQAVLSAMAAAGYVPEEAERIGFVRQRWIQPKTRQRVSVRIPFEWFERHEMAPPEQKKPRVLLLWVDEDNQAVGVRLALARLIWTLLGSPKSVTLSGPESTEGLHQTWIDSVRIKVIGPTSSTTLRRIMKVRAYKGYEWRLLKEDDPSQADDPISERLDKLLDAIEQLVERRDGPSSGEMADATSLWDRWVRQRGDESGRAQPASAPGATDIMLEDWISEQSDELIDGIDKYLDDRSPLEPARTGLKANIDRALNAANVAEATKEFPPEKRFVHGTANLAELLRRELPTVIDSDPLWAETVVRSWRAEVLTSEDITTKYALASFLVDEIHDYLDDGLQDIENDAVLIDQLAASINSEEAIKKMLREEFGEVVDSDPDWINTVVDWYYWLRGEELDDSDGGIDSFAEAQLTPREKEARERRAQEARERSAAWEQEKHERTEAAWWLEKLDLEIYSFRATAPDALIRSEFRQRKRRKNPKETIEHRAREHLYAAGFISTIANDADLMSTLVDEMARRGVNLLNAKDHVVLVGEWDSFYSRAIPFSLGAEIRNRQQNALDDEDEDLPLAVTMTRVIEKDDTFPTWVHKFSYLRGIDGRLPGQQPESPERSRDSAMPGDGEFLSMAREVLEWPDGRSQLDYMRRLGDRIAALERSLQQDKGERIAAIGVTGTDLYDKQLVLQALRERFPRALFFTTDLDARLMHPSQYDWSRNLIVLSSFGLELHPDLQRNIPPFRDSYQTSSFLACLLALRDDETAKFLFGTGEWAAKWPDRAENLSKSVKPLLQPLLKPRVFEIGRSGAYDITPKGQATRLHPDPRGDPDWKQIAAFGVVFLLGMVLLIPVSSGVRRFFIARPERGTPERRTMDRFTYTIVVAVALFLGAIYLNSRLDGGEPFEFFEGISIWPTQLARLFVIILCLWFYSIARQAIDRSDHDIAGQFGLTERPDLTDQTFWARWQQRRCQLRSAPRVGGATRMSGLRRVATVFRRETRCWWALRKQISISVWRDRLRRRRESMPRVHLHDSASRQIRVGPRTRASKPSNAHPANAERIWLLYVWRGNPSNGRWRFVPAALAYIVFAAALLLILEAPSVPYRGMVVLIVDRILGFGSFFAVTALTFFVVDATRLCEQLIRALGEQATTWSAPTRDTVNKTRGLRDTQDLDDYIGIHVIARRSEVIGRLLIFPFLAIAILLLCRNSYFDAWRWPTLLILIYGVLSVYAILCAMLFRRAAESARNGAIARLNARLCRARSRQDAASRARSEQLHLLIDEVRQLRSGAFSPWFRNPTLRAALIPFGGAGIVVLLDLLASGA